MKVYNYGKIKNCFICGNIDGNFDRFIKNIIGSLKKIGSYQVEVHPKEIERQERLKRKREEEQANNGGGGMLDGMPIYAAPNPQPVRPSRFSKKIPKMHHTGDNLTESVVIVDGSNSFGERDLKFYHDKLEMLNKVLADNNTHILFTRGHDDPKYFEEELLNLSNIKTIQDYSVIKLNKFNCLCIGGAVSLDRSWKIDQEKRVGRKMYWEGECLQYRENELEDILKKHNIACVVTTSCPSFAYPGMNYFKHSSWISKDKSLLKDVNEERIIMDKIYNKIVEHNKKPYIWVYSRYKSTNQNMINDILFYSLNSFQFFDFNNTAASFFKIDFSKMLKENEFSSDSISKTYKVSRLSEDFADDPFEDEEVEAEGEDLDAFEEDNHGGVEEGEAPQQIENDFAIDEDDILDLGMGEAQVDGIAHDAVGTFEAEAAPIYWRQNNDLDAWRAELNNIGGVRTDNRAINTQEILDRFNEHFMNAASVQATAIADNNVDRAIVSE